MSDSGSVSTALAARAIIQKTAKGAYALGIRQVLVQGTRILSGIFLARLLTPMQFGFYAIVLYLQTFLTAFGDAGLAASLVRQPDEPSNADYQAVFTVQQLLVLVLTSLLWGLAPIFARSYHLPVRDAWLFRTVSLSFLVTSFMVIPQVGLERRLAFDKLAIVESTQAILFNITAVYLAWAGKGAYAFVWALLLRSFVGTLLANYMSPWRLGWHWNWAIIRPHLTFGLYYQASQVTTLLKDSITPVFIGILLGTADVGYITWAAMIAAYPVMALFILQRLYMPAFARLQEHREELASMAEHVIWATNVLTAPFAVITLALIVPITTTVYGPKWLVALPYFYFFWLANLFVPTATPAIGLLNALGKSRLSLMFSVIWMAGTWLVGLPLIWFYGAIGFAVANFVVQFSNIWLFVVARKYVPFRVLPLVVPVWIMAALTGVLVFMVSRLYVPRSIAATAAYGVLGLSLFGLAIRLYFKDKIYALWSSLREAE